MTTTFQVGQKVRCVNGESPRLKDGEVYTVARLVELSEPSISLAEVDGTWYGSRFAPWPDPPEGMLEVVEDAACDHKRLEMRCMVCGESVPDPARQRDELLNVLRAVHEPRNWDEDGNLNQATHAMVKATVEKYKG